MFFVRDKIIGMGCGSYLMRFVHENIYKNLLERETVPLMLSLFSPFLTRLAQLSI